MTYTARRSLNGWLFITPYLLSFLCFVVLPILVSLVLSGMQFDLTAPKDTHFVGLQNYRDAIADDYFRQALQVSLLFALLIVPGMIVLGLAFALGLNAMTFGMRSIRALLFLPGMLNVAVVAILWQWFYNGEFGLFNFWLKAGGFSPIPWLSEKTLALPSAVLMTLWWQAGGTSVILLAALQQIPAQVVEAARLDGAGSVSLVSRICLPLLKPVMLFVVITNTIAGLQVFGQPFLLTRGGPELSTRGVVQYIYETAFNNYRLGYGAAMSWLLFGVAAVFALVQYRVLRRSMA